MLPNIAGKAPPGAFPLIKLLQFSNNLIKNLQDQLNYVLNGYYSDVDRVSNMRAKSSIIKLTKI